jgi:hypothetical protein
MSKYSYKIKKFLDESCDNFDFLSNFNNISFHNNSINNIFNCITLSVNKKHTYVVLSADTIHALHSKNQYPLSYILFSSIKKDMNISINNDMDFKDFNTFIDWHRKNIH